MTKSTQMPTHINRLELAGWGGGAGGQLSIVLTGPMELVYEDHGAVVVIVKGDVLAPTHVAFGLGGDCYKPAHSNEEIDRVHRRDGHLATAPMHKANKKALAEFLDRLCAVNPNLGVGDATRRNDMARKYSVIPEGFSLLTHVSQIRLAG